MSKLRELAETAPEYQQKIGNSGNTVTDNSKRKHNKHLAQAEAVTKSKNVTVTTVTSDDSGVDEFGSFIWEAMPDGSRSKGYVLDTGVKVIGRTTDENGSGHGILIEYCDPRSRTVKETVMPYELAGGDYAVLRSWLLAHGITPKIASPGIRTKLPLYFLQHAQRQQRWITLKHQTGWHGNSFVLPAHTIGADKIRFTSEDAPPAIEQRGTLDDWKRTIAISARGNSRLLFAISAALAGPLLQLAGVNSGGFHYRGFSSVGKTIALLTAATVWGSAKFVQTWRSTANGIEAMAAAHSDLCLLLDEIKQIAADDLATTLYTLAQETGKQRATKTGGAQVKRSWRTMIISTGEISPADALRETGKRHFAGHDVRFIDIPADAGSGFGLFDTIHDAPISAAFAERIESQCRDAYGSLGPAFIEAVINNRESVTESITRTTLEFKQAYAEYCRNGQANRAASRFALVAAAGELATEFGLTGWQRGEVFAATAVLFEAWIESRGSGGPLEESQILSQVRRFLEEHGESRFVQLSMSDTREETRAVSNRAGYRKDDGGSLQFCVLPEVFKGEIAKGFDYRNVADLLAARGFLFLGADSRRTQVLRISGEGTRRVYVLSGKLLE